MSQYGGSNADSPSGFLHDYGIPNSSKHGLGRSDEKAPEYAAGESASYDNIHGDSRTLYDQKPGQRPEHRSEYKPEQHKDSFASRLYNSDRNIPDFFYKQPDPTYSGMYGTDYQPQISKTKVAGAVAGVAALVYGFSQYKKRRDGKKKFEKYTKPHHSHRTKKTSASTVGREDSHDGRSRY
ncbi:hypothetical protein IWW50_002138 [Coemansia erecta]|nr:hypothetical protein IWW50_002138 [Coemansia erecta]